MNLGLFEYDDISCSTEKTTKREALWF